MRRHSETLKLVIGIVVGILFIYGFYTYNDLHSRYKKTEENNDKLQQLHESLSSQLQVVYEHKSRLEKSLQQEKLEYSKARDEWEVDKTELETKQKQLTGRVDSINKDLGMLKGRHEDLETDYSKLQEEHRKLAEDHRILTDQHNDEYRQFKVDCENQMVKLKDQVADQGRRLENCLSQVSDLKRQPAAPSPRKRPHPAVDEGGNAIPNVPHAGGNVKDKQINDDGPDNARGVQVDSDNRVERDLHGSYNGQQEAGKQPDTIMQVPQPRQNDNSNLHAADGRQVNLRRGALDDGEVNHQVAAPRVADSQVAAGDVLKFKDGNGPDDRQLKPPAAAAVDGGNRGNHPAGGAIQPDNNNDFAVVPPAVQDNNIGRVGGAGNHADPFAAGGQGQASDEEERRKQQPDNGNNDAPRQQQQQDDGVVAPNQALQPPPAARADGDQRDDGDDNDDNGDAEDNAHVGARPIDAIGQQLKRKEDVDGNYQEDYKDAGGDNH